MTTWTRISWPGSAALVAAVCLLAAGCSDDGIVVDLAARTVSVPAVVTEQGKYSKELKGAVEYLLVATGGKEYESIFTTSHSVTEIHKALEQIGLRWGQVAGDDLPPGGQPVEISVESERGTQRIAAFIEHMPKKKDAKPTSVAAVAWPYTGSVRTTHPDTNAEIVQAELTHSIIGLHWSDPSALVQNPREKARDGNIYRANMAALPEPGTPVRIIFRRPKSTPAPGARCVHIQLSGRLQGTGFNTFVENQARRLKLAGFIRATANGAEAVIEGPAAAVTEMCEKIKTGPRAARVEKCQITDQPPEGDFGAFEIWY
jgi:acylphosphatase